MRLPDVDIDTDDDAPDAGDELEYNQRFLKLQDAQLANSDPVEKNDFMLSLQI